MGNGREKSGVRIAEGGGGGKSTACDCKGLLHVAKAKDGKAPRESDMMAMMMELMKPGDNHKLLAQAVGSWTYSVKAWMNPDPKASPMEYSGSAVFREAMGGRYVVSDHTGKMQMPG